MDCATHVGGNGCTTHASKAGWIAVGTTRGQTGPAGLAELAGNAAAGVGDYCLESHTRGAPETSPHSKGQDKVPNKWPLYYGGTKPIGLTKSWNIFEKTTTNNLTLSPKLHFCAVRRYDGSKRIM